MRAVIQRVNRAAVRVDAVQEVLVSPEGRAQASPSERPGAGLRKGLRL